jgi:hypothetical protein
VFFATKARRDIEMWMEKKAFGCGDTWEYFD